MSLELFPNDQVVGVFRGFSRGGLEFHADLVLPYRNEFQNLPMHGQFLLVQLENQDEAVLGRITSLSSAGKLSSGAGEEFNIRAVREGRPIPEDLREQYLKYQIDIRVLGVIRKSHHGLTFVASHRRLPHVGSPVAFLSGEILRELVGHNNHSGAEIGHFALGEYVYAQNSELLHRENWMQVKEPEVLVRFPIENLVSRRSFIFARAGFGKSNLNKLLFSKLYEDTPTVTKKNGRKVPVGTVLFDPDGEYFWPDDKGRPGLCDVPGLEDKLVVFTNRAGPSPFYESFVAGGIKLDIRRLKPSDVISIALNPERQNQQNVRKLRGLNQSNWEMLVDLISKHGHQSPIEDLSSILNLEERQEAEAYAARANMTTIVSMLHDKNSQLMDRLLEALGNGKLCVIDVSQMRGGQSLILSSLILRRIFDKNQQEFTASDPKTIPTIAVVEEAQSVLNEKATGSEPYIAWVKEGRKYDLGAVLITQQPGSIPTEILSQGDNWFIFHLLSASDLGSVKSANAHFSQDVLSALLNEPIPGQGVFWSSANERPFPIAIRVLSFEKMYSVRDPNYDQSAAKTFAQTLKQKFEAEQWEIVTKISSGELHQADDGSLIDIETGEKLELNQIDVYETFKANALKSLADDEQFVSKMKSDQGVAWGSIKHVLMAHLPNHLDDRDDMAYNLVKLALDNILGPNNWKSYKNAVGTTYVKRKS